MGSKKILYVYKLTELNATPPLLPKCHASLIKLMNLFHSTGPDDKQSLHKTSVYMDGDGDFSTFRIVTSFPHMSDDFYDPLPVIGAE